MPYITINPRDFALWLLRGGGTCPDIGGEWFRRGGAAVRFADHYDDTAPGKHTRRHATISIYPGGGWLVTLSHGPDQIFRSGQAADCVDALRAALGVRARWLDGEHCGEVGCRRCPPMTRAKSHRRRRIARDRESIRTWRPIPENPTTPQGEP